MKLASLTRLLVALAFLAAAPACKQGIGDRCQVDNDCSSGLCNAATGRCQEPGQDQIDASVDSSTPDAAIEVDAGPEDAGVDAS